LPNASIAFSFFGPNIVAIDIAPFSSST